MFFKNGETSSGSHEMLLTEFEWVIYAGISWFGSALLDNCFEIPVLCEILSNGLQVATLF